MFVITGASGQLGRAIIEQLLPRVPSGTVRASVRDPGKASDLAALGAEVRRGDYADPASLQDTFAGADSVLIVSADKLGDEARDLHRAAIAAAKDAGVSRILYTSHAGAKDGSLFMPADQHAHTEADLAASGLAWTALRHGFYAESCLQMIEHDLAAGELRVPQDGPVAWTSRADLAEADAAIIAGDKRWESPTPALTASRAVTMAEVADLASEVLGRTIRHTTVSDEEWRDAKIVAGVPPFYADLLLGTFRAARQGDFATVDPTLEQLLGRAPRSLGEVLGTAKR